MWKLNRYRALLCLVTLALLSSLSAVAIDFTSNCTAYTAIDINNAGRTQTLNWTAIGEIGGINTTFSFNESNFTFTNDAGDTELHFFVRNLNNSGNAALQNVDFRINRSAETSIRFYHGCNFPGDRSNLTTGTASPVMIAFYDANNGLQGWTNGSGNTVCTVTNSTDESNDFNYQRFRGQQSFAAVPTVGTAHKCRSPDLNLNDSLVLDIVNLEFWASANQSVSAGYQFQVAPTPNNTDYNLIGDVAGGSPNDFLGIVDEGTVSRTVRNFVDEDWWNWNSFRVTANWSLADPTSFFWVNGSYVGNISNSFFNAIPGFRHVVIDDGNVFFDDVMIYAVENSTTLSFGIVTNLTGSVANLTVNLTDLTNLTANYSITFFANTTGEPDDCWVSIGTAQYNATRTASNQICNLSITNINASQDLNAIPRINRTSDGSITSGTSQDLVIVRRNALFQNHSLLNNETVQYFLLEFSVDNRISNDHNTTPFSHNSTSPKIELDIIRLTNTSQNVSIISDVVTESIGYLNGTPIMINQSGYWLRTNFSFNTIFALNLPSMVLSYRLRGFNGGQVNVTNDTNTAQNYTVLNQMLNFTTIQIPANTTFNYTLNFSSLIANLTQIPASDTQIDLGATIEHQYFQNLSINWVFSDRTYNGTIDIGTNLNNFVDRVNENFSATQPNGTNLPTTTRSFADNVIYAYTMTLESTSNPGNYTLKTIYTRADSPEGGQQEGGGGGGGGGGTLSVFVSFEQINLSVKPSFIQRGCFFNGFKNNTALCRLFVVANKNVTGCEPRLINQDFRVHNECRVLPDQLTIELITLSNHTNFLFTAHNEFIVTSIDGEKETVTSENIIINFGVAIATDDGLLPKIPFFVRANDENISTGIFFIPAIGLLLLLGGIAIIVVLNFGGRND